MSTASPILKEGMQRRSDLVVQLVVGGGVAGLQAFGDATGFSR
ncbi:hypothetical protein AB0O20_00520 [Streptomyces kronopolitis]